MVFKLRSVWWWWRFVSLKFNAVKEPCAKNNLLVDGQCSVLDSDNGLTDVLLGTRAALSGDSAHSERALCVSLWPELLQTPILTAKEMAQSTELLL